MAAWVWWLGTAGVLVAIEIFTGTFFLLMLALGFAAGGIAALAGVGSVPQFVIAGAVGSVAIFLLSHLLSKRRIVSVENPDMNPDIGRELMVNEWQSMAKDISRARVAYRGSMWDVELAGGEEPVAGIFVIQDIRANCLIVGKRGE
jgi:membrane protein implicated in regulation of membrane protease activity